MNILLVDDDKTTVDALCKRINWEKIGFSDPFCAYSAEGARKVIEENYIHIMLCDIEMPGESGIELLHWIREKQYPLECIFLTNYLEFSYAQKALKLGSFDYIAKNGSTEEIESSLQKVQRKLLHEKEFYVPQRKKAMTKEKLQIDSKWENLLRQNQSSQLLFEIKGYLSNKAKGEAIEPEQIHSFYHDFLQMVFAVLKEKNISSHEIFQDDKLIYLEKYADHSMIELVKWLTCLIPLVCAQIKKNASSLSVEQKMQLYIHENYQKKIGREEIAANVHLTPEYAARLFKEKTGCSINNYLAKYRIEKAKELMLNPQLSISEIAEMTGYEQFSYFSTNFKYYEGMSPREYRKNIEK